MKDSITMATNFIASKGSDENRIMHTESHDMEIMIGSEKNEIIEEFFNLFCKIIQMI